MTFGIYVRTGNSGTDPDFDIRDLGFRVISGANFVCISSASNSNPTGSTGNFTAVQIRDSKNLYDAIIGGQLEWSTDGYGVNSGSTFEPDALFVKQISNNNFDLSGAGRLSFRNVQWFWQIQNPVPGEVVFKDGYHYGFDGYVWYPFGGSSANAVNTGPTPPGNTNSLWLDNGILKYYDNVRIKWLSSESHHIHVGRNGLTPPGVYYRAADSMVMDNVARGVPARKGTITYLAAEIVGLGAPTTIEVVVSGTPVAELICSAQGLTYTDTLDVDINHGFLSVRNKATGAPTDNAQIVVGYRLR